MTKKSIFEAALSMKAKDRELLVQELAKSLFDHDELAQGAEIASERILRSDRNPSRRVSKEDVLKILEVSDE